MTAPRPWMKFYPSDWRADPLLRTCSMAARGLWMELIALMHESERYGYLLINGRQPGERQLAALCGVTIEELEPLLLELETNGVFDRDRSGAVLSRRMVRDEQKHLKLSKMGKKGVARKAQKQHDKSDTLKGGLEGSLHPRGQSPEYSVSKDTAQNPENGKEESPPPEPTPIDPIAAMFRLGLDLLKRQGLNEQRSRSLIGKWRKDFGEPAVMAALTEAHRRSISELREWMPKYLASAAVGAPDRRPKDHLDHLIEKDRQREEWARERGDTAATLEGER